VVAPFDDAEESDLTDLSDSEPEGESVDFACDATHSEPADFSDYEDVPSLKKRIKMR
jgi:hypothetical protein